MVIRIIEEDIQMVVEVLEDSLVVEVPEAFLVEEDHPVEAEVQEVFKETTNNLYFLFILIVAFINFLL